METLAHEADAVQPDAADRAWYEARNAEAHAEGPCPVECLLEPNPRDAWPEWTDLDCWEDGPERTDADWDALCEERWGTTTPSGWPDDTDCCPGGIG